MQKNPEEHKGAVDYFSFWKLDPIPPKNTQILPFELHSLGRLEVVTQKLFDVPGLKEVEKSLWEINEETPSLRLRWPVEEGIILQVRAEQGPPKPGEVLTIHAASAAANRVFYRLYVQLFEQFGVTVLDERSHDFLTPREFRDQLGSEEPRMNTD